MSKLNCWEFKKCGNGPVDNGNERLGLCVVSSEASASGLNGGVNGGRVCWVINGTFCASKANNECPHCEFRYRVMEEEGFFNSCKAAGEYIINLRIQKDANSYKDTSSLRT